MTPQVVTDERETSTTPTGYLVSVNLSLTLLEMAKAGKYDHCSYTTKDERFLVDRSGTLIYEKELFLVAPSHRHMTTDQWKAELNANEWDLEQTPELLALGAKYPNLQREHHIIIAFGTSMRIPDDRDDLVVSPVLYTNRGWREAARYWSRPNDRWYEYDRALVSRKRR